MEMIDSQVVNYLSDHRRPISKYFRIWGAFSVGVGIVGLAYIVRYLAQLLAVRYGFGLLALPLDFALFVVPWYSWREYQRVHSKLEAAATEGERQALALLMVALLRTMILVGWMGLLLFMVIGKLCDYLSKAGFGR